MKIRKIEKIKFIIPILNIFWSAKGTAGKYQITTHGNTDFSINYEIPAGIKLVGIDIVNGKVERSLFLI